MKSNSIRIVRSDELSKEGDERFVVVDAVTGKVLDNARGYGFKSRENAEMALRFRNGYNFSGKSPRELFKP